MNEESIFAHVIEIASPDERSEYLNEACAGNIALRGRVERLVEAHLQPDSRLDAPPIDLAATAASHIVAESVGSTIGPYRLLELIGEGGMGLVFMAEQQQPLRRMVALKIIKPGMDSRQIVLRFEAERQTLALMDHPHIAKILDSGTTDSGRPYFVMELVRGIAVTDYCDQAGLNPRQRLGLFLAICQAVQHAHQHGIIHRDLKPANILVTMHDDVPVTKVIDFGVAKALHRRLIEQTLFTNFAQLVGTPVYMSPEQAQMSILDVDTRSDVYSLGVLLYELLTGTTPFDRDRLRQLGYDELRRIIREEDPPPMSSRVSTLAAEKLSTVSQRRATDGRKLATVLRGELDWIVMKTLEKNRERRYESASALAADVQRYLDHQPVEAHPPSAAYRARKFARRNRTLLTTCVLVGLAMITGTAASIWQAVRATDAEELADNHRQAAETSAKEAQQRTTEALAAQANALREKQEAERQRNTAFHNLYAADARLGLVDWNIGNVGRLSSKLLSQVPIAGHDDLRGWEWYYLLSLCHQEKQNLIAHSREITSISWSPDRRFVASTGRDDRVNLFDTATWRLARTKDGRGVALGGCWSPDGRQFAWGSTGQLVCVWDIASDEVSILHGHESSVWAVTWSPDGRYLASGGLDLKIRVWDPASGSCLRLLDKESWFIDSLEWSPKGDLLAAACHDGRVSIRDTASWEVLPGGPAATATTIVNSKAIAWSPDGKQLALGSDSGMCYLYNTSDWSLATQWQGHTGKVMCVSWNADGSRIASAGADRLVQVSDSADGRCLFTLRGHVDQVNSVAWDPGEQRLASSGVDGMVKIWELPHASQPRHLVAHPGRIESMAWSDDLDELQSVSFSDNFSARWNIVDGNCQEKVQVSSGSCAKFSSDGALLAIGTDKPEPTIRVYDCQSGKPRHTVKCALPVVDRFAFSPDDAELAVFAYGMVEVHDLRRDEVVFRWSQSTGFKALSWSADRRFLAAAGHGDPSDGSYSQWGGFVHVFDVAKSSRIMKTKHGNDQFATSAVAWSPNGKWLVSANVNGRVEVWEVASSKRISVLLLHTAVVHALEWSPDGRRVASASADGTVRVWHPFRGEELLKLDVTNAEVLHVAWSSNGQRLAAATAEGAIYIWDASPGYEYVTSDGYEFELVQHRLNEATRLCETGDSDRALALFDAILKENKAQFRPFHVRSLHGLREATKQLGKWQNAIACDREIVRLVNDDANVHNDFAWRLVTCPASELRDPVSALTSARKAVALRPDNGAYWNTFGAALYRNDDWAGAVEALFKSMQLRDGGDAFDWIWLAMAHWQLGHKEEAKRLYQKSVEWMDKNAAKDDELLRFRAEAAELLGLHEDTALPAVDAK